MTICPSRNLNWVAKQNNFDYAKVMNGLPLKWIFKVLDLEGTGELSKQQLMCSDPAAEARAIKEAKRARFTKRKKKAAKKKEKAEEFDLFVILPEVSPRDPERESPVMRKIAEYGAPPEKPESAHDAVPLPGQRGRRGAKMDLNWSVEKMTHAWAELERPEPAEVVELDP